MAKYIFYPTELEDLKDGDRYQTQLPKSAAWSKEKIFSSNICRTKKDMYNRLILTHRIRVIKNK